jgi:hypothetical protein
MPEEIEVNEHPMGYRDGQLSSTSLINNMVKVEGTFLPP